jgi:flagellar FliJ protein
VKQTERMQKVQRAVDDAERRRAEQLAACERRVRECEAKLAELEAYEASYARQFTERVGSGMGAAGLRDYPPFRARLAEAIRQQTQLLARARAERDAQRQDWQNAAQRAEVVGHIVKRWQHDEQRRLDKREQNESDERSQRSYTDGAPARGI